MLGTRELLPGTLDMLVLKALSLGPAHGYGVLLRIEATSQGLLVPEQGSLYPALNRRQPGNGPDHRRDCIADPDLHDQIRMAAYSRLLL